MIRMTVAPSLRMLALMALLALGSFPTDAKVYQVDPLVCTRCGKRMSLIAFVTDQVAIGKILDHLGLSTPEAEKPPPPVPEILRVAEEGDGWGVSAQWDPA